MEGRLQKGHEASEGCGERQLEDGLGRAPLRARKGPNFSSSRIHPTIVSSAASGSRTASISSRWASQMILPACLALIFGLVRLISSYQVSTRTRSFVFSRSQRALARL